MAMEFRKMIDFREQIKAELKKQKLSIPKLAVQIGCHQQTIYNYVAGRSPINADLLEKIFTILKIR
jgi:transcriptional regulator with XRE-family HTH domain